MNKEIITNEDIKVIFDNYFGFCISLKTQLRPICYYRYLYCLLCKEHSVNFSHERCGAIVKIDHSTSVYGVPKYYELMEQHKSMKTLYNRLKSIVSNYRVSNSDGSNPMIELVNENLDLKTQIGALKIEHEFELENQRERMSHKLFTEMAEMDFQQLEDFYNNRWKIYKAMNLKHIM